MVYYGGHLKSILKIPFVNIFANFSKSKIWKYIHQINNVTLPEYPTIGTHIEAFSFCFFK